MIEYFYYLYPNSTCSNYHTWRFIIPTYTNRNALPLKIVAYKFSTAGAGKDVCDTFSALQKQAMNAYVRKGNNVLCPEDIANSLVRYVDSSIETDKIVCE